MTLTTYRRTSHTILLLVLATALVAFGSDAGAQPPIEGTYKSRDIGGLVDPGRYSLSWSAPDGRENMGNTIDMTSWDGSFLGDQWQITCSSISGPPQIIRESIDSNGNGSQTVLTRYLGGFILLEASGPWDGGGGPYNGVVNTFTTVTVYMYQDSVIVGVVRNVSLAADILGFPSSCASLVVGNTAELGNTDSSALPGDFPLFMDPNCDATRVDGSWGDANGLSVSILGCDVVGTDERTWGSIKTMYDE